MNTQHTPGPWAVQFEGEHSPAASGVYSKGKATGRICTVPPMHEDREANARLIAAAPDLLAALEEQHRLIEQFLSGDLVVFPSAIRHQVAALIEHSKGISA